jgi:hypothetical protein
MCTHDAAAMARFRCEHPELMQTQFEFEVARYATKKKKDADSEDGSSTVIVTMDFEMD